MSFDLPLQIEYGISLKRYTKVTGRVVLAILLTPSGDLSSSMESIFLNSTPTKVNVWHMSLFISGEPKSKIEVCPPMRFRNDLNREPIFTPPGGANDLVAEGRMLP